MVVISFIIVLLLIVFAAVNTSLKLTIDSRADKARLSIGDDLNLELSFVGSKYSPSDAAAVKSYLCLMIDGAQCHCFHETIDKALLLFPPSCSFSKQSYYLSVMIYVPIDSSVSRQYKTIVSSPVLVSNYSETDSPMFTEDTNTNLITLVLPLTMDDFSRSLVLFDSLRLIPNVVVKELLVVVPDWQYSLLHDVILAALQHCNFSTRIVKERSVFESSLENIEAYPYGIQMGIKLSVARIVTTPYYLTLDADLILLHPFDHNNIFEIVKDSKSNSNNKKNSHKNSHNNSMEIDVLYETFKYLRRSIYDNEPRGIHSEWWTGSENVLKIPTYAGAQGFGVTPAILSTFGSLLTLSSIRNSLCSNVKASPNGFVEVDSKEIPPMCRTFSSPGAILDCLTQTQLSCDYERILLESFGKGGVIWSEYTIYRSALDFYEVFDELHTELSPKGLETEFVSDTLSITMSEGKAMSLHCLDVWYDGDLPWRSDLAFQDLSCLFSVVQSSTNEKPSSIYHQYLRDKPN